MTKRRDVDDGTKHAVDGACYSLRPEYNRHVPCLACACGQQFCGATWEDAGIAYDEHLDGEEPEAPAAKKTRRKR